MGLALLSVLEWGWGLAAVCETAGACPRCATARQDQIATPVIERRRSVRRSNKGKPILERSGTERASDG